MPSTAVAVMVVVLFTFQVCGLVQVQSSVGSGDISGLGSVQFNKTGYGSNLVHLGSRFNSVQQERLRVKLSPSRSRFGSVQQDRLRVKLSPPWVTIWFGQISVQVTIRISFGWF
ncbi:hypothetical protein Hanom_Chr15g01402781 [Helianthus anomalus]